jgi:hypothetical protein
MRPVIQAILIADNVYTDVGTGKKIIAGTFNQVVLGEIKTRTIENSDGSKINVIPGGTDPGCPMVYLSLTDVVDGTKIFVQFVNMSKNETITGIRVELAPKDRLATVEIVLPLPPVKNLIREVGVYSLDVVWNGEILGYHRIIAKAQNGPNKESES